MFQLIQSTCNIFEQLKSCIEKLTDEEYTQNLSVLQNGSISKHTRHVLEFYQILFNTIKKKEKSVCYDNRAHDTLFETCRVSTLKFLDQSISNLSSNSFNDGVLNFTSCYNKNTDTTSTTSISRELLYTLEHSVHHMAIIKIAITHHYPNITLPSTFGIAKSTIEYQKQG